MTPGVGTLAHARTYLAQGHRIRLTRVNATVAGRSTPHTALAVSVFIPKDMDACAPRTVSVEYTLL